MASHVSVGHGQAHPEPLTCPTPLPPRSRPVVRLPHPKEQPLRLGQIKHLPTAEHPALNPTPPLLKPEASGAVGSLSRSQSELSRESLAPQSTRPPTAATSPGPASLHCASLSVSFPLSFLLPSSASPSCPQPWAEMQPSRPGFCPVGQRMVLPGRGFCRKSLWEHQRPHNTLPFLPAAVLGCWAQLAPGERV